MDTNQPKYCEKNRRKNNGLGCTILQNKWCIACLILLGILVVILIGVKLYINSKLNEVEVESFETIFSGLEAANGTNMTDNFLENWEPPEDIRKEIFHTFSGFDHLNRPVWILPVGKWDLKKLIKSRNGDDKDLKMYADKCLYRIFRSMKHQNSSDWVLIANMEDFSYSQLASLDTLSFYLQMGKVYQPLFHTLAYGFSINMDYFSEIITNLLRPILGSHMDRIEFINSDKDKYIPAILRKIPANQLPLDYGGSKSYRPIAVYD